MSLCYDRGCDADRGQVVWFDGDVETTTCPVRSLTPDTQTWMRWFERTHDVEAIGQGAIWRRRDMPSSGGLDRQDAKLMDAMDCMRGISNRLLAQRRATDAAEREMRAHHDQVRAERRGR